MPPWSASTDLRKKSGAVKLPSPPESGLRSGAARYRRWPFGDALLVLSVTDMAINPFLLGSYIGISRQVLACPLSYP